MFKELKVSFQATSATRIARWPQPLTKLFSNDEKGFENCCLDGLLRPSDRLGPEVESECSK